MPFFGFFFFLAGSKKGLEARGSDSQARRIASPETSQKYITVERTTLKSYGYRAFSLAGQTIGKLVNAFGDT